MAKKSSRNGVPTAPCPVVCSCTQSPYSPVGRVELLLEEFRQCTHQTLLGCADEDRRRAFLARRGFDVRRLDALPIGLFASDDAIVEHLRTAGFTAQEIEASELVADPRLLGRFVGPIRDPHGKIVSFWAHHPAGHRPRFLFKGRWKDSLGLFGLDVALQHRAGGRDHLLVVEPLLDAVLLQDAGLPNVAATCDPFDSIPLKRWQRVAELNVRRITLILSLPEARRRKLDGLFELLQLAGLTADIFLFCPESSMEVARYVREEGRQRLLGILVAESIRLSEIGRQKSECQNLEIDQAEPTPEVDPAESEVVLAAPSIQPEKEHLLSRLKKRPEYCELHRCSTTECFCFD